MPVAGLAQSLRYADSVLASGDTASALALYQRMVSRNRNDSEARYRAARILMTRFSPDAGPSADRRAAEEHLRFATRQAPDSAKYWLALVDVFESGSDVTVRRAARRALESALGAVRHASATVAADVYYRAARMSWIAYEEHLNRHQVARGFDIDMDAFLNDWNYVEDLLGGGLQFEFAATVELRRVLTELETALTHNRGHLAAAALEVVALGQLGRWEAALAITDTTVRYARERGEALALRGLSLARLGRWREAETTFDQALATLPGERSAPYRGLDLVRAPDAADESRIESPSGTRAFWLDAQPLWTRSTNEARTEFYARITYALHRWGDITRSRPGHHTPRGQTYVRFGPPDDEITLGAGGADAAGFQVLSDSLRARDQGFERVDPATRLDRERQRTLWVYRTSRLRFIFAGATGYGTASFAASSRHALFSAARQTPVRYDNVPSTLIDSLSFTTVQFRGPGRGTDVVIVPHERPRPAPPINVLLRADGELPRHVAVWNGAAPFTVVTVALPGPIGIRLEREDSAGGHAARGAQRPDVRAFPREAFAVSDILLGTLGAFSGAPDRWSAVDLLPLGDAPLSRNHTLGMVFEVYPGGVPNPARYDVELTLRLVGAARRGIAARIVGGVADALGLSARGDDAVTLRYPRALESTREVGVEVLEIDLAEAVPGTYELRITAIDTVGGRRAEATTTLVIASATR